MAFAFKASIFILSDGLFGERMRDFSNSERVMVRRAMALGELPGDMCAMRRSRSR